MFTNGTLAPDEAVSLAAKVLSAHLSLFVDLSENAKSVEVMSVQEDNEKEKVMEMNIDELELSVRSYNCLKRAGINTVEELVQQDSRGYDEGAQPGKKIPGGSAGQIKRAGLTAKPQRRVASMGCCFSSRRNEKISVPGEE